MFGFLQDGLPDIGDFLRSNLRGDAEGDDDEKVTFKNSETSSEQQVGKGTVLFEESGP